MFDSVYTGEITLSVYLLCTGVALLCGLITAPAAAFRTHATKSFITTLILLPAIVETVILMVNGNVGTGIAVAGAFSLVRFRSVPGKAKEIAAIFLVMTAGLTCAAGYLGIALLFSVGAALVLVVLGFIPTPGEKEAELRITVPESLSYKEAFDDIFATYTSKHTLVQIKTTAMGSLFKLRYRVRIKTGADTKDMLDALRCRNGNLEIALTYAGETNEEL